MVLGLVMLFAISFPWPASVGCFNMSSSAQVNRSNDEVTTVLAEMESGNPRDQQRAKQRLLFLAKNSGRVRAQILRRLISIISGPNQRNELMASPQKYRTFKLAVEILGDLRATEALEALVACLDCNDGMSGESGSRYPATLAVAKFGEAAVPLLGRALLDEWVGKRLKAAEILGLIGGTNAKELLEKALLSETDESVIASIRIALHNLAREQNRRRSML